jgi:hypothetical protein
MESQVLWDDMLWWPVNTDILGGMYCQFLQRLAVLNV